MLYKPTICSLPPLQEHESYSDLLHQPLGPRGFPYSSALINCYTPELAGMLAHSACWAARQVAQEVKDMLHSVRG
jgi:hypothetical protein